MTRMSSVFLFCSLIIFGSGCAVFRTHYPVPVPSDIPTPPVATAETTEDKAKEEKTEKNIAKENKERIKTKTQIIKEFDSFRNELKKIEVTFANKRAEGVNVGQAEEIWRNSNNLLKEAERLYLEANLTENYESVFGLLQAIEDSFLKIKEEIKKAPRFREKTKPKPKEYMDDRDLIFEKIGHIDPTHIRVGPMFRLSFSIFDSTEYLSDRCFDGHNFTLQYPPKVMIMESNKGQEGTYQFVLIENDPNIEQFTKDAILSPESRDLALSVLCMSQGSGYENYKFLAAYKGKMAGSPEMYLEQLLSGRFRFADQFGLGAITENAKGGAGLADLELVSLVFSTKIDPLSRAQGELLAKIHDKVKDDMLSLEERQQNFREARATGELLMEAYWEEKVRQWNEVKTEKLKKAFDKITTWQGSFSPKKNDKKNFLNAIADQEDRRELEELLDDFEDKLTQLAKEFERIQKELLRFKKDHNNELVFYDDENPVMILLLEGVGFKVEESSAGTLFKKDIPQLLVKFVILYYRSKNDDEPLSVGEDQYKIENANKYIDVSKDYQRLTSFMLGWPLLKTLPMGNYQLKLTITDEIREKAVIQEVNFTVLPAALRGK